jgi:glycosyltransferase involved in cell wall biosynthesis
MSLLVDGFVFENTHQKGIRRYMEELLRRVDVPFSILLENPAAGQFPENWPLVGPLGPSPESRFNLPARWIYRERAKKWRNEILSHSVFHSAYYRTTPVRGIPTVMVVHDMVFEIMPGQFLELAGSYAEEKHAALETADAIIAVSETTRRDLISIYPEYTNKVHVVLHGADHLAFSAKRRPRGNGTQTGTGEYALFVGSRSTYKNFGTIVDAMCDTTWPNNLDLLVAGAPFSYAERLALKYRGLETRVHDCGRASDSDLAELYAGAKVFVFPSLFEGFGFPLLEAQAKGVPVAASDIEIFQEVGGAAFEKFQPLNPASVAGAVARAIEPIRAGELRKAGFENLKKFTWAETAKKTVDVWKLVSR